MPSSTYILKLECIGDDQEARGKLYTARIHAAVGPDIASLFRMPSQGPWVAELVGLSPQYGFERQFLPSKKDYRESNSIGSRGVYRYFELRPGPMYEVSHKVAWKRRDRYFCRVAEDGLRRLSQEEVRACLSADLA